MLHKRLFLVLLAFSWLLTGCWHVMPVDRRGMVTAIGVDKGQHGQYLFSVALVNPVGLPSPGGKGGTSNLPTSIVYSAASQNLDQALHMMTAQSHLHWDLAHVQALAVSEEVAREGLLPVLDYFMRTSEITETARLFVARGSDARHLLESGEHLQPYQGIRIDETAMWTAMHLPYWSREVFDFVDHVPVSGKAPTLTGLSIATQGEAKTPDFKIDGVAVFRGDKLIGWLSKPSCYGLAFATGRVQHMGLSFPGPTPDGSFNVDATSAAPRIHVWQQNSVPFFTLDVHVKAYVTSVTPEVSFLAPENIKAFEGVASRVVLSDIVRVVSDTKSLGVDPIGFGEALRVQQPSIWRAWTRKWPGEPYRSIPVRVSVSVALNSVGDKVQPLLQPTTQ